MVELQHAIMKTRNQISIINPTPTGLFPVFRSAFSVLTILAPERDVVVEEEHPYKCSYI